MPDTDDMKAIGFAFQRVDPLLILPTVSDLESWNLAGQQGNLRCFQFGLCVSL